jgi:hypothetical protein
MRAPGHRGDRDARKERKHRGNNTNRGKSGVLPSVLRSSSPPDSSMSSDAFRPIPYF